MLKRGVFIFVIFFLANAESSAQVDFNGYLDSRVIIMKNPGGLTNTDPSADYAFGGYNRTRLKLKSRPSDDSYLYLAADLFKYYGYLENLSTITQGAAIGPVAGFGKDVSLDRAYLQISRGRFETIVGRQRIAWGRSLVWSPFDVFNRKNVFEPGEEKRGVDGITVTWRLGMLSALEAAFTPGETFSKSRLGGRLRFHVKGIDAVINAIQDFDTFTTRQVTGVNLRGEYTIGWWIEYAFARDRRDFSYLTGMVFNRNEFYREDWYPVIVAGADYTFPVGNGLTVSSEFMYDQSGKKEKEEYDYRLLFAGRRSFLAQKYVYSSFQYDLSEFWSLSAAGLVNLDDGGVILIPNLRYLFSQNVDFTFGTNIYIADEGTEYKPALLSEYAGYLGNSQFYTWIKVYF